MMVNKSKELLLWTSTMLILPTVQKKIDSPNLHKLFINLVCYMH